MYALDGFSVKEDSLAYPSGTGHQYQVVMNGASRLLMIEDDNVPEVKFDFVKWTDCVKMPLKSKVGM